jgi:UDP-N-acetylglucosamine--N-acetylmuramyl-(pentapeptide) pyrophosphoryl-undecaprenol N-acetylglucosamine transferase
MLNLGIPGILVPSANVAENHQYFNAKSLSDKNAAILIEDKDLKNTLVQIVLNTLKSESQLHELQKNELAMAKPNAANIVAQNAIKYVEAN